MKTPNPYERNLRAERIRNSGVQFFCVPFETLDDMRHHEERAPRDTLFKNYEPNCITEISLSYLQNMSICYPPGK